MKTIDPHDTNWWRHASVYQIYPRSFQDSNGDGIGDLRGVINRLPYLAELGIDAIWLSPFFESPNNDGGYDISNPRAIAPEFGTLEDAEELINKAHHHGLRIIFDIVPNHFSSHHPWFQEALEAKPGSKERARFHFADGEGDGGDQPPNNWTSLFGGPAWTRVTDKEGKPEQWYLHIFDTTQPDLNWSSEDIKKDFDNTLKFWLDRGVDGFRIDVAHGLVKEKIDVDHPDPVSLVKALRIDDVSISEEYRKELLNSIPFFDKDGVHEIYRHWRTILDSYSPTRMSVAECFVYPPSRLANYVRPDELHQVFNFDFMLVEWDAEKIKTSIANTLALFKEVQAPATWALNNHDSMRVASRLKSLEKATALALLIHALPGSVYIYQGEELGLFDGELTSEERRDPICIKSGGKDLGRDGGRVPIPWSSEETNFGFSTGEPWLPLREGYLGNCVDRQVSDPQSTLNLYRESLKIRQSHPDFTSSDEIEFVSAPNGIVAFNRGDGVLVFCNTNNKECTLNLASPARLLIASQASSAIKDRILTVGPNSTVWIELLS
jgi:alpha-glucosidase